MDAVNLARAIFLTGLLRDKLFISNAASQNSLANVISCLHQVK